MSVSSPLHTQGSAVAGWDALAFFFLGLACDVVGDVLVRVRVIGVRVRVRVRVRDRIRVRLRVNMRMCGLGMFSISCVHYKRFKVRARVDLR